MEGGGEVGVEREARVKEGGGECGQRGQSEGERWWVWSEARMREVRPERERGGEGGHGKRGPTLAHVQHTQWSVLTSTNKAPLAT